jgi:hypothetical protein
MKQSTLLFVAFTLAAITIVLFLGAWTLVAEREDQTRKLNLQAQQNAEVAASSGFNFLLENRPVEARLFLAAEEFRRGDSLSIVLRLDNLPAKSTNGLGNEFDGVLTPTLTVGDCSVTPLPAASKSTKEPLSAFVWQWSVDDCKSVGNKAVQVILAFTPSGAPNGSDPVAYRDLKFVRVVDPFSWDQTLRILGTVTGFLTVAVALANVFIRKNSAS